MRPIIHSIKELIMPKKITVALVVLVVAGFFSKLIIKHQLES